MSSIRFVTALRSPLVRAVAAFSMGVLAAALLLRLPANENAADWASAFGSFAAACIALWLGVSAARRDDTDASRRAAVAATVISPMLFSVRATVDVIAEYEDAIKTSPASFAAWAQSTARFFRNHGRIVDDRYASFLADIPTTELRLIVLADNAFEILRRSIPEQQVTMPGDITRLVLKHAMDIRPIVLASSEALHTLSNAGGDPPWVRLATLVEKPPAGLM